LAIAACLLQPLGIILRNPIQINHDAAACLVAGAQILAGKILYVDIVDTNPPLIYYLHVVPAAIARWLGTPLVLTFMLLVWLATVASTLATWRLCRLAFRRAEVTAASVALSVALSSAVLMYFNDYGQREHLFALAFLPYLSLRACRVAAVRVGAGGAVSCGILAGLAACIKPHFVALWLGVEVYLSAAVRPRRSLFAPEIVAFVATGLVYAIHFALLPPSMRDAWFGRWLPLIVRGYRAYEQPIAWLAPDHVLVWLPAVVSLAIFNDPRRGPEHVFVKALIVTAIGGLVAFAIQRKDWMYQTIPVTIAVAAIAGWVIGQTVDSLRSRMAVRLRARLQSAMCAALAAVLAAEAWWTLSHVRSPDEALREAASGQELAREFALNSRPGDAVLVIATSVAVAYPSMAQFERVPGSRFMFSFPLPMLYFEAARDGAAFSYELPAGWRRDEEARFRRELQDDIVDRRPSLILVGTPRACQACPRGFNLDDYLARSGFRDSAMRGYRFVETGTWASIYVRN